MFEILNGDCIEMMLSLPDNSVDTCVTSPPYWGLRDYGGGGKVWGPQECIGRANFGGIDTSHEWEGYTRPSENTRNNNNSLQLKSAYWEPQEQAQCKHCDAWFGQLGLEPNIEQYVKNMVEVFSHVHRILKPEGTLWLNLGDSYASGKSRYSTKEQSIVKGEHKDKYGSLLEGARPDVKSHPVLKDKDLVGVPWRVAFALQEAGWWLRQDIIWAKPNCMPESVKDRCTKNHEYMFLLTKSHKYYFDNEAIKEKTVTKADKRKSAFTYADNEEWAKDKDASRISKAKGIADARVKDYDKRNKRSVWWVGPKPFPEAHFAVFPIELIEPCILAGSPVGGTVFDPFGGSGTTAIAAIKHGRNAILAELSEEYVAIAEKRIADFKAQEGLDKKNVEWL